MSPNRLEKALGYTFTNPDLLREAITHRSHSVPNNERLEFIGDSLLNCVVAMKLYERFPKLREGELSRLRAQLVCQDGLHKLSDKLMLGDFLRLGEGELKSGGFRRPSILADATEAIFGAIYQDSNFETAKEVIDRLYAEAVDALNPAERLKDPKTVLQEWLQSRKMPLPSYTTQGTSGEEHSQTFHVVCRVATLNLTTQGDGPSRRIAEQNAAKAAIELLPNKKPGRK